MNKADLAWLQRGFSFGMRSSNTSWVGKQQFDVLNLLVSVNSIQQGQLQISVIHPTSFRANSMQTQHIYFSQGSQVLSCSNCSLPVRIDSFVLESIMRAGETHPLIQWCRPTTAVSQSSSRKILVCVLMQRNQTLNVLFLYCYIHLLSMSCF